MPWKGVCHTTGFLVWYFWLTDPRPIWYFWLTDQNPVSAGLYIENWNISHCFANKTWCVYKYPLLLEPFGIMPICSVFQLSSLHKIIFVKKKTKNNQTFVFESLVNRTAENNIFVYPFCATLLSHVLPIICIIELVHNVLSLWEYENNIGITRLPLFTCPLTIIYLTLYMLNLC